MPTVLRVEGFRFFFFSNEAGEPPHIHVEKAEGYAKFWLQPVRLAESRDLSPRDLRRARELAVEHEAEFLEKWREHFGA